MTPQTKRILILIVGWGFVLLGVVGLVLPFLQGVLFIFAGIIILSSEYAWAKRLLEKLRTRFPKIVSIADRAATKAAGWMKRFSEPRS
jgi:uncharacterized protein